MKRWTSLTEFHDGQRKRKIDIQFLCPVTQLDSFIASSTPTSSGGNQLVLLVLKWPRTFHFFKTNNKIVFHRPPIISLLMMRVNRNRQIGGPREKEEPNRNTGIQKIRERK
jgi:hypothetical protein